METRVSSAAKEVVIASVILKLTDSVRSSRN